LGQSERFSDQQVKLEIETLLIKGFGQINRLGNFAAFATETHDADYYQCFVRCDTVAALEAKTGPAVAWTVMYNFKSKPVSQVTPAEFMQLGTTEKRPARHPFLAFFERIEEFAQISGLITIRLIAMCS
jgi:hypothetical protein